MYDYDGSCPRCDRPDVGWELRDERGVWWLQRCSGCEGADEEPIECYCEGVRLSLRINRVWDKTCPACGSADWRAEWQLLEDGRVVATTRTQNGALAVLEAEYPGAVTAEADNDGEAWLRRAEGWG
jgi:RNA polymerase subunit RPABC4/transcription elongation factor Spt4